MNEYEVWIEEITPCGGEKHSRKSVIEVEAASPEVYVKENGRYPIMDTVENGNGDTVIVTGDGNGYMIRYTFSE